MFEFLLTLLPWFGFGLEETAMPVKPHLAAKSVTEWILRALVKGRYINFHLHAWDSLKLNWEVDV